MNNDLIFGTTFFNRLLQVLSFRGKVSRTMPIHYQKLISIIFLFIIFAAPVFSAPSVGSTALILYRDSNFHKEDMDPTNPDPSPNGLNIQELEIKLSADVDLYTELNLVLSVHPYAESDGTQIEEKWLIEPEEVYAENNRISFVQLKLGKFKAFIGKHNTLHTHAFVFVEEPLGNTYLLGEEGLNDTGASASIKLPTTWASDLTLQYLRGKGENESFKSPRPGDGVSIGHLKNLLDLSHATSLELGVSAAIGANSFRKSTTLSGADVTLRWTPTEAEKYNSLFWTTEYLQRRQEQPDVATEVGSGFASWVQYQISQQWATVYRYDNIKFENSFDPSWSNEILTRNSFGIAYTASEFSTVKVEINQRKGGLKSVSGEETENTFFLQFNLTMDAHAGHDH